MKHDKRRHEAPEDGIEFQGWWEVEHHSVDQIL